MYCKHCGKELSDEAPLCPNCGTPTENSPIRKPERNVGTGKKRPCAVIGFVLSLISLVTTIILVTMGMICGGFLGETLFTVSSLAGLVFSIFGLSEAKKNEDGVARGLAITGIVFASVAIFYIFIIDAIFTPMFAAPDHYYY